MSIPKFQYVIVNEEKYVTMTPVKKDICVIFDINVYIKVAISTKKKIRNFFILFSRNTENVIHDTRVLTCQAMNSG